MQLYSNSKTYPNEGIKNKKIMIRANDLHTTAQKKNCPIAMQIIDLVLILNITESKTFRLNLINSIT